MIYHWIFILLAIVFVKITWSKAGNYFYFILLAFAFRPGHHNSLRQSLWARGEQTLRVVSARDLLRPQWFFYIPSESELGGWRDGAYGLTSLPEKTWKSNHLQMWLQRQHFLLNYFKTLSIGRAGIQTHNLPHRRPTHYHWAIGWRLLWWIVVVDGRCSHISTEQSRTKQQTAVTGCGSHWMFNLYAFRRAMAVWLTFCFHLGIR